MESIILDSKAAAEMLAEHNQKKLCNGCKTAVACPGVEYCPVVNKEASD